MKISWRSSLIYIAKNTAPFLSVFSRKLHLHKLFTKCLACRLLRMPFLPSVSRRRRIARSHACPCGGPGDVVSHPVGRSVVNELWGKIPLLSQRDFRFYNPLRTIVYRNLIYHGYSGSPPGQLPEPQGHPSLESVHTNASIIIANKMNPAKTMSSLS